MEAKTHRPTTQESAIVERVVRIVSSVRGVRPDYARLAAELEPTIPFDIFGVVLLRHDHEAVRIMVCERRGGAWTTDYRQHPLNDSMAERLLRHMTVFSEEPDPIITNYPAGLDGLPAQSGDALCNYPHLRASFIAPLIVEGRLLGTLELGSTISDVYDEKTLQRLMSGVARVIATAIDGAQVGGNVEIQNRQRRALRDVSSALTSTMDLSLVLNEIVVGVSQALNVASAIVLLYKSDGLLRLEAQQGLDADSFHRLVHRPSALQSHSILGYTLRSRQPCVSPDIGMDARFPLDRVFVTELDLRSLYSYPLVTGTTVYGALLLCSREPGGFTPLKTEILSLFASQATIAIHNGMLIESAQQRRRFQAAIEQLERVHSENGDEREVFERVRREAEQTFGIRFSSLLHFISSYLLTRNERDLHEMLSAVQPDSERSIPFSDEFAEIPPRDAQTEIGFEPLSGRESIAILTQMAETAFARAEALKELASPLLQLQRTMGHASDAWFVADLRGYCLSLNAIAELFCGVRNDTINAGSVMTIEEMFAALFTRIRNQDSVRTFLRDFVQERQDGAGNRQDQRCILMTNVEIHRESNEKFYAHSSLNGSGRFPVKDAEYASDQHYQLIRYPLYNQGGVLVGQALQVYDVTAQVRDEKNKSALLSSVSHDFRTPLTTIKAAVTGLMQQNIPLDAPMYREILEDMDAETDHLEVLVSDLIEMSRIEMGALVLEHEWCDILEIVHGAMMRCKRLSGGHHIRFHMGAGFRSMLPPVYADRLQLERVFSHLIQYVAHHLDENAELPINVAVVEKEEGEYLRVQVIDRGKEIPARDREFIFKTFSRSEKQGSGLDLAICRGIVEAHQGYIAVEALPGGEYGSCFTCLLPLRGQDSVTSERYAAAKLPSQGPICLAEESVHEI